jgi:hypothetical protein
VRISCRACGGTEFAVHAYAMLGASLGPDDAPLRDFDFLDVDSFELFCDSCGEVTTDLADDVYQAFATEFERRTTLRR